LLATDLKGLNLISYKTFEEFYLKQIIDSYEPIVQSKEFYLAIKNSKYVVDLGVGGGFPSIVLAAIFPETKFVGIDARQKKIHALNLIVKNLGLKNYLGISARIEQIRFQKFDGIFISKALGKVDDVIEWINCDEEKKIYFYKGPNFTRLEIEENKNRVHNRSLLKITEIKIPDLEARYLVETTTTPNQKKGHPSQLFSELLNGF